MKARKVISDINSGKCDELFLNIYGDKESIQYQRNRYTEAIECFMNIFGDSDVELFSAPGRSEFGGNHTDHQHGEVLAAAVNLDMLGIVKKTDDNTFTVMTMDSLITVPLDNLEMLESEKETSVALLKGIAAGFKKHGYSLGGFSAYVTSDVLIGAGLSSSASFETLIGIILSGLYNDMSIPATDIALIGQFAENSYFLKPCGLMDQIACSTGGIVHINLINPDKPIIEKIDFDLKQHGYCLCITDTNASHEKLTSDYAFISEEMTSVASFFGKNVLVGITMDDILNNIAQIRTRFGDRAFLRAFHFILENERVRQEAKALANSQIKEFLSAVAESGNSSFKYLQNVCSDKNSRNQEIAIALAISENLLGDNGVCRVHGGGFAGTIQAFVRNEHVAEYKVEMDRIFGNGSCQVLCIRKHGGIKVI